MKHKRIGVFPGDIVALTGKGERYARKIIQKTKEHFGKEKHQIVTYYEAAEYLGINKDTIFKIINNIPITDLKETG